MEHKVNKGADRGVEFSGLQAQYLYVLAGGLLSVFLVFVILYMAGVNRWFCILFGTVSASLESKFPGLSVERGCILSKDADVTVGF